MDIIIVPPVLRRTGRNLRNTISPPFILARKASSTATGPAAFFTPLPPGLGGGIG